MHDDDEQEIETSPIGVAETRPAADDDDLPAAILWLPSPASRSGWTWWSVNRRRPDPRPLGFNRNRR